MIAARSVALTIPSILRNGRERSVSRIWSKLRVVRQEVKTTLWFVRLLSWRLDGTCAYLLLPSALKCFSMFCATVRSLEEYPAVELVGDRAGEGLPETGVDAPLDVTDTLRRLFLVAKDG